MSKETTNCSTCKALVYAADVPLKASGNCWRCEVKQLRRERDARVNLAERDRDKARVERDNASLVAFANLSKERKDNAALRAEVDECEAMRTAFAVAADTIEHLTFERDEAKRNLANTDAVVDREIEKKCDARDQVRKCHIEVERYSKILFTTIHRLQKIVIYYGTDTVDTVVKRWNEGDGDGMIDWLEPPPGVDEALEKLS